MVNNCTLCTQRRKLAETTSGPLICIIKNFTKITPIGLKLASDGIRILGYKFY